MEHLDRRVLLGAAGLAGVAALSKLAHAGPLNPPAGPVTGTGKTTQEIFDRVAQNEPRIVVNAANVPPGQSALHHISQPGSYVLAGDINGQAEISILITASNVVLDLRGYTIYGDVRAIRLSGARGVVIRNGCLSRRTGSTVNWGVVLADASDGVVLEDLVLRDLGTGVISTGATPPRGIVVRRCVFREITFQALWLPDRSSVLDCTVDGCGAGIWTGAQSHVERCQVRAGTTMNAIQAGESSLLVHCLAAGNAGGAGFQLGNHCTLESCEAISNTGYGVFGESGLRVITSRVRANTGGGIRGVHVCQIRDTHVHGNGGWGIDLVDHGQVERCQVSDNAGGGIRVSSFSRVSSNSVDYHPGNGISGIRTTVGSGGCQILDNHVSRSANGIFLDGGWHLAARNALASLGMPIINLGTNNNAGVLVTGAGAVGSMTNPSANIYF